ncbi:hypothetical protein POF50_008610 [Streptomyces sp. SL13]|uniref:Peptidase inhibitor family I36 n=1 Tax=Streptantibioticus silvisoli TaxID=2705255 RepID=A0AA90KFW3_9ACTN|nr:hypothetical protein [Streptantibioticus silvisoli]MDI5969404.1 hypothetical protein [Streptantibioticus silvisoli]
MTRKFRTRLNIVAAVVAALGFVSVAAEPSSADTSIKVSSNCDVAGQVCTGDLYMNYHSVAKSGEENPTGSFASFYGDVPDQAGTALYEGANLVQYEYVFASGLGDGSGIAVKNDAASADDCSDVDGYRVYYNSGYAGHSQAIPHYYGCAASTNLDSTLKNENASSHFA